MPGVQIQEAIYQNLYGKNAEVLCMRNVSLSLGHLNSWCLVGGAICEDLDVASLAGEGKSLGSGLEIKKPCLLPFYSLFASASHL